MAVRKILSAFERMSKVAKADYLLLDISNVDIIQTSEINMHSNELKGDLLDVLKMIYYQDYCMRYILHVLKLVSSPLQTRETCSHHFFV